MWLEVSDDLSIVAKKIVAVKSIDQLTSIIYTEQAQFEVTMPKSILMSLIESRVKGASESNNVEKLLHQMYQGQSTPRP